MLKSLSIFWNSFKMSVQELNNNKLRSSLSLIGIAFGIFCIIGVLATLGSLESKVQGDIQKLGSNTIQISKWQFGGGDGEYPWWKYVNRPVPKFNEVKFIKEKSPLTQYAAYFTANGTNLNYGKTQLNNVGIYGISEEFNQIETINIYAGRFLNTTEFLRGNPVAVIGYDNAEQLFGKAEKAVGKTVDFDGKRVYIIGVIEKQGQSFGPGFDYDYCVILSYRYFAAIYNVNSDNFNPFIMVKGKNDITSTALSDELEGVMRQVRKLSPTQEDNFALNDVQSITDSVKGFFGSVKAGGWAIAALSLIVGAFGVANIMFVTV
ncbi:MAG TPA: ABC transporter permease, partial [Panacibacter sp.]|nr:ABC transporter permease [Panacibacter sp.]